MTARLTSLEVDLPDPTRQAMRERAPGASWQRAKIAIALLSLAVAYYGFWRIRGMYLSWAGNSDVLYLASLYRDLVSHHYPLTGWRLTPAPYFFPDMPLFFLSAAVTPNLPSAYCLYSGIMLSAIFACTYWIGRAVSPSRADRLLAVGLMALLMFVLTLRSQSYWIPMRWLLAPSGHSGSLLCGLILIGLTLDLVRRVTTRRVIVFTSISFLVLASDQLLLSQFLAPIIVATLVTAAIFRSRQHLIACATITVSGLIAWRGAIWALQLIVHGTHVEIPAIGPRLAPSSLLAHWWPQVKQDWHEMAGPGTPLFLIAMTSLAAIAATMIHMRSGRQRERVRPTVEALIFVACVAVSSLALSFGVPVLTSMWGNIDCFRYELSFVALPLLLLAMCFVYAMRRLPEAAGSGIALAAYVVGVILSLPARHAPAVENAYAFYSPTVCAFDQLKRQYGLHAGFADYWLCRNVTLFSKEHVLLSPLEVYDNALTPTLWIDNPNHWCQSPDGKPGDYPIYDFAVCSPISEEKIRERFGTPAGVVACAGARIMIYNRPFDVLFRSIGRAEATTAADAPLESQIIKLRFLNHAKPPGYAWNGSTKVIYPGHRIELRLTKPVAADVLNITANSGVAYQIELKLGENTVGKTELNTAAGDNLQPHDLLLAPITGGKAFDRIIIAADKAPGFYSIGSVMVFIDPVLHPRQPSKIQRQ